LKLRFWNNLQRLLAIAICGSVVTCDLACSVTIIPPVDPPHPTVVYLCDYGVHSSLLLPVSPGRYVEYLYGDWNWAALCHTSWLDAIGAIFWSGQATLGRRYVDQTKAGEMPVPPGGVKTETAITVNGDGCEKVIGEMGSRWEKDRADHAGDQPVITDFWYVKDRQHYYWLHDCNLNTADSLAEMGCTVRGFAVWSNFKIAARDAK
jgi:hypothetical protein